MTSFEDVPALDSPLMLCLDVEDLINSWLEMMKEQVCENERAFPFQHSSDPELSPTQFQNEPSHVSHMVSHIVIRQDTLTEPLPCTTSPELIDMHPSSSLINPCQQVTPSADAHHTCVKPRKKRTHVKSITSPPLDFNGQQLFTLWKWKQPSNPSEFKSPKSR